MPSFESNSYKESPDFVRISAAAAIALGFQKGKIYRNAQTFCINLLQTYHDGCKANCLYCGQARDYIRGNTCEQLIRVGWPNVSLDRIIQALIPRQKTVKRVCVAMLSHPRAGENLISIINRLKEKITLPISALVTPTNLKTTHIERLHDIGTDVFTVALDAATKPLFNLLRGKHVKSPHRYEKYFDGLKEAIDIFGQHKVGAHLIVGLGETEREMVTIMQKLFDLGVNLHQFSFYPEQGSALESQLPPSIGHYRRIQLFRYLMENNLGHPEKLEFNEKDQIVNFGLPSSHLDKIISSGKPFETSGCSGCNRPYANARPSESIRNFPFKLEQKDIIDVKNQLTDFNVLFHFSQQQHLL